MEPSLTIQSINSTERIHPKNLIRGYMFDPTREHVWEWKYNHFPLGWMRQRIRCRDCGKRVMPSELVNNRCSVCREVYDREHPYVPEKFYGIVGEDHDNRHLPG